jgi:hypothetical protein
MRGSNRLALTGLTIGILLLFSVAGLEACLLRGSGGGGGGIYKVIMQAA